MSLVHARRSRWSRALFLAWSVPLLLLAPVLSGRALLWHAHDDAGAHLHVLAEHEHASHEGNAHQRWLADEHHRHADEHHDGAPPAPDEHRESDCFVVSLAGLFCPGASARGAPQPRALLDGAVNTGPRATTPSAVPLADSGPAARRLRAKLRSGTARIVATSHALRI